MSSVADSSVQTELSASNFREIRNPTLRFDPSYLTTTPGLLKLAEAVICIMGLICMQTIHLVTYNSPGGWYYFVSMTGLWISLFFLACYLFHIVEKFKRLPWHGAEILYATIWVIFCFIAAIVAAMQGKKDPAWVAASFFAFTGMIIYGVEAYQKSEKWRRGEVPQDEVQIAIVFSNPVSNSSIR